MFCLPLNPGKIGFYNFFFQGTMRVIEEYRNQSSLNDPDNPLECYYLFELNNDAACTVKPKHLSAGSIMLIM